MQGMGGILKRVSAFADDITVDGFWAAAYPL